MSFNNMTASQMRTRIIIESPDITEDGLGGEASSWNNVFGEGKSILVRWVKKMTRFDSVVDNAKNDRVFSAEVATITTRYTSRINSLCRVRQKNAPKNEWWYIIGSPERSVNGNWVEFTVERRGAAL